MTRRNVRTLIAALATLGLVGALTAIPVAAQSTDPCEVSLDGTITEEVTDGVTLTFDSDFVCANADATGSWSIIVNVANLGGWDVSIDTLALSHVTPPFGDIDANSADAGATLPIELGPGTEEEPTEDSFTVGGDYTLAQTDDGALRNLHLRARGTATDGEETAPFVLGINVHVLGPGVELDDEENGENGENGAAEGRPEWVPGPPPWVRDILVAIFPNGFPWGTDAFPPHADADENGENGNGENGNGNGENGNGNGENGNGNGAGTEAGPPSWVTLPPQAGGGDGADDEEDEAEADGGPPASVSPGGPPDWVPGGRP
jgi:hypothetical protein